MSYISNEKRDLLAAEESAEVAEEDEYDRALAPEFPDPMRPTLAIPKRGARQALGRFHAACSSRPSRLG